MSAIKSAINYRNRGLYVVPVERGLKGCKLTAWQNLRYAVDEIPTAFKADDNLLLILGINNIADVDLDSMEAIRAARFFLPETGFRWGRAGKPNSHALYYLDKAIPFKKYVNPVKVPAPTAENPNAVKTETICEFRSTTGDGSIGLGSIVPPGIHESGDTIRFEQGADQSIARVDADVLFAALRHTAGCALLAKYWPEDGSGGHTFGMALGGALCQGGLEPDQAKRFILAAYQTRAKFDDSHSGLKVAQNWVTSAYKKHEKDAATTGYTKMCELVPGAAKALGLALEWLGYTIVTAHTKKARSESDKKPNHADILLGMIGDFEYFKSGPANEAYVRMSIGDHRELWHVSDRDPKVREILTHRFLLEHDRAPGREALNTVMDTITAKCSMGPKVDVWVRFARSRDVIYLDLADDQWRAVEITKAGWRVMDKPPVLFRRAAGARPLPVPVKGGALDQLRPLLNSGDDAQWLLMISWLVGVFLPEGAFVHLVLNGEQGSAKTSVGLALVTLLDPSDAGLTSPPKDEVDATVSALHAGVLAYDNMSGCRAELSDVFCRFSTGQGYRVRTLYQNLGVTVASVKLPVIMNGISSTVMRGDLVERCIMLKLPTIPPEHRLTEKGVVSDFAAMHAGVLGALLDVVATGLRNLPHTALDRLPRMSDFALWISACEPALPWSAGQFMKTYFGKMKSANMDLVEGDTVASALVEWAEKRIAPGQNTRISTRELLTQLNNLTSGWPKDLKYWPASSEDLAHKLVRLAPVLRAEGVEVRKMKRTATLRSHWEISRQGPQGLLLVPDGRKEAA